MMERIKCLMILMSFLTITALNAHPPTNFNEAKKIAMSVFKTFPSTLYCQCPFDTNKMIDLDGCGMHQARHLPRANRVEWEHIMAAEHFGHQFACWKEQLCTTSKGKKFKGRKCCEQIDSKFKRIESELYNLWPAVGAVNEARSNYHFTTLHNKRGYYGCAIEVEPQKRAVEPPDESKGIVARAILFMSLKYDVGLSDKERELLTKWNEHHPPKDVEIAWAKKIADIEGYDNPFITNAISQAIG